jgi:hypothetical protein
MIKLLFSISLLIISVASFCQKKGDPWTTSQLLAPKTLAATINDPSKDKPVIISIGPAGLIKGAVQIGPVTEEENMKQLKKLLAGQGKDKEIVVYCGCCPFGHCPNIRPAFALLKSMDFKNPLLLNLPSNLKVDWLNYGYPMDEK